MTCETHNRSKSSSWMVSVGRSRGRRGTDLVVVRHDGPLELGGVYPSDEVLHVPGEGEAVHVMEGK